MTVERAIEYIHSNYWNGGTFGLDRTVELLDLLGHPEKGLESMARFAEACAEFAVVEKPAKLEGRNMLMFLAPKPAK